MSDRHRRDFPTSGRLALTLLGIVGALALFGAFSHSLRIQSGREIAQKTEIYECNAAEGGARECQERFGAIRSAAASEAAVDVAGWTFWLNVAGFLGLAATVFYARRAWLEAGESARAAREGLVQDAEQSARELRAYVHQEAIEPKMTLRQGSLAHLRLQLIWKNCGQTPARNMRANCGTWIGPKLAPDFGFPDFPQKGTEAQAESVYARATRGPGQFLRQGVEFDRNALNRVTVSGERLFMWGWVEYSDVFPNTPRRRTEAAFEIVIDKDADGYPVVDHVILQRFNGMDEDCMRGPVTT